MSIKRKVKNITSPFRWFKAEFSAFLTFLFFTYTKDKLVIFSFLFEKNKNTLVKTILSKRGKTNRVFLHVSAMLLLTIGVVLSPFVSQSNPFSANATLSLDQANALSDEPASLSQEDVFDTARSKKPRSQVEIYTVQKGDTVSTIAEKFDISADTIRWENGLKNDNITVGDEIRILPVTGIAHKVQEGDTVYSIAKKYSTNAQAIVDFPFNDFANPQTFSLIVGQILFVPEGVRPEEAQTYVRPQQVVVPKTTAQGNAAVGASGFAWPIQGVITQYYAWYHTALDIAAPIGTGIVSAHNGKVAQVYVGGWNSGYGTHVLISGYDGYTTLYAHMSAVNVSVGDEVVAGRTIVGWVGMTGRTTGPHLHFEVRTSAGGFISPLSVLR